MTHVCSSGNAAAAAADASGAAQERFKSAGKQECRLYL